MHGVIKVCGIEAYVVVTSLRKSYPTTSAPLSTTLGGALSLPKAGLERARDEPKARSGDVLILCRVP
jgi:hypothetical protein